jgi:hypothetical protein
LDLQLVFCASNVSYHHLRAFRKIIMKNDTMLPGETCWTHLSSTFIWFYNSFIKVQLLLIIDTFEKCNFILTCSNNLDRFQLTAFEFIQIPSWPSHGNSSVHLLLALFEGTRKPSVLYFLVKCLCSPVSLHIFVIYSLETIP